MSEGKIIGKTRTTSFGSPENRPKKRSQPTSMSVSTNVVDLTLSSDEDNDIEIVRVKSLKAPRRPPAQNLTKFADSSKLLPNPFLDIASSLHSTFAKSNTATATVATNSSSSSSSDDIQFLEARPLNPPHNTLFNHPQHHMLPQVPIDLNRIYDTPRAYQQDHNQTAPYQYLPLGYVHNMNHPPVPTEPHRGLQIPGLATNHMPPTQNPPMHRNFHAPLISVKHNGRQYNTENDVLVEEHRLRQLLDGFKRAQRENQTALEQLPNKMLEKMQKKKRLVNLGVSNENPVMTGLMRELAVLSGESREARRKFANLKLSLDNATKDYLNFVNRDKSLIIQNLRKKNALFKSQNHADTTNSWGAFANEVARFDNPFNRIASNTDLDEEPDDLFNSMFDQLRNNMGDPLMEQQDKREFANGLNVYQSDTADLRSLLESVKVSEEAAEGEALTPDELTINLLPHQRMGLHWLLKLESTKAGGILADDMGLGKTIQMIALMMENRAGKLKSDDLKDKEATRKIEELDPDDYDEKTKKKRRKTQKKIDKTKEKIDKDLPEVIVDEDLKETETSKDQLEKAFTSGDPKKESVEKQKDEEIANEKEPKVKTNLIVCPVSLMNQWKREIDTRIKESADVTVFIFHSLGKKDIDFKKLSKYDVVITSYTTLVSEYKRHVHGIFFAKEIRQMETMASINIKKRGKNSYISPFFSEKSDFYRVILDEAQMIKNSRTIASVACASLESTYRWCLSGTPMQNSVDELYPLIRFLKIRPYCNQSRFITDISRPLKPKKDKNEVDEWDQDKAMKKLRVLLRALLLRREKNSKIDGKPILQLPDKTVREIEVNLSSSDDEASFYYSLEASSKKQAEQFLNGAKAAGDYSNILTLLLRLRQACLHSELVKASDRRKGVIYDHESNTESKSTIDSMLEFAGRLKKDVVKRVQDAEAADEDQRFECPICLDNPTDQDWNIFYPCGHGLCTECVEVFFEKFRESTLVDGVVAAKCTHCRTVILRNRIITYDIFDRVHTKKQSKEAIKMHIEKVSKEESKNMEEVGNVKISPKLKYALDLIKKILNESTDEKVILFSQFTSLFDIFIKFLDQNDIDYLLYLGSMTSTKRNDAVREFYENPRKRLILISLKAGNVGLTLTCANHVIIMDPFWNPFVEEQAQDRAYRIGQQKPVTIYRPLIKNTVEDRILVLQGKKKELIKSAMSEEGRQQVQRLNRQEIGFLFGINELNGAQ